MPLIGLFKGKGPSGFGFNSTADDVVAGLDLAGKTVLLTGCNSGIGLATARALARRGAHVIGVARTVEKARTALAGSGTPLACDLGEPASVRQCVAAVRALGRPLDALIANAGIMALPKLEVRHGFELQFLTNHIGHFILVNGLLERLAPAGRVVMVASEAHRGAPPEGIQFDNLDGHRGYRSWQAYGHSKLANILFARALGKRLAGTGRTANSIHPGVIATNLTRHMNPLAIAVWNIASPLVLKSAAQGAATQCYAAVHPGAAAQGAYFSDCNLATPTRNAQDDAMAERLWSVSEAAAAKLG